MNEQSDSLRCSTLVNAEWLQSNGWELMHDSSMYWHSRSLPFVAIRLCDVSPRLQIGSPAVGWHIVTDSTTQQDVIDLRYAMKCPVDA